MFKLQLNALDSYISPKPSFLDPPKLENTSEHNDLPILRAFGTLPTGHSCCVHIHGVLPYLFLHIEQIKFTSKSQADEFALKIEDILNKLVDLSFKRKALGNEDFVEDVVPDNFNKYTNKKRYIASVEPCRSYSIYGYHHCPSVFFKVSYYNPHYKTRIVDTLNSLDMSNQFPILTRCQILESSIPFVLQFMADYNLSGCGWLEIEKIWFRDPIWDSTNEFFNMKVGQDVIDYINPFISGKSNTWKCSRMSHTIIEIDCLAGDIINRKFLKSGVTSTGAIWDMIAKQRKENHLANFRSSFGDVLVSGEKRNVDIKWSEAIDLNHSWKYLVLKSKSQLKFTVSDEWMKHLSTPFELIENGFYSISEKKKNEFEDFKQINVESEILGLPTIEDDINDGVIPDIPDSKPPFPSLLKTDVIEDSMSFDDYTFSQNTHDVSMKQNVSFVTLQKSRSNSAIFFSSNSNVYNYKFLPPNDLSGNTLPKHFYTDPFYGNEQDVPAIPYVNPHTKKRFKLTSMKKHGLSIHDNNVSISNKISNHIKQYHEEVMTKFNDQLLLSKKYSPKIKSFKYIIDPPGYDEIMKQPNDITTTLENKTKYYKSQIEFLTPNRWKAQTSATPNIEKSQPMNGYNHLCHLIIETHIIKRKGEFEGAVGAIFWKVDNCLLDLEIVDHGALILEVVNDRLNKWKSISSLPMEVFSDELDLFNELVSLVRLFDPDILSSYEVNDSGWGYVVSRCFEKYNYRILNDLSRVKYNHNNKFSDNYGYTHAASIRVTGRYIMNIWRLVSKEVALLNYNIENVVKELLHFRIPRYDFKILDDFFFEKRKNNGEVSLFLQYYESRVDWNLRILNKLDLVYKIIEQARLGGIDFYSVYYRGSQYKVESFLLRLSKQRNFLLLSPSRKQVRFQRSLECLPLVMEPSSGYYKSPLVVLDFQSLYPSIMIAYNYCYSTCLGRLRGNKDNGGSLGVLKNYKIPDGLLGKIEKHVSIAPNGVMFVKPSLRKSILGEMLYNILDTRIMVKSTMKELAKKNDPKIKDLLRLYENRQLALKLIANVTYGYTSATFSGRMPCSDIADAIVQTARETLENAIRYIESQEDWQAKVVYGDTDSLFVYLPGRSKNEAFKLGELMAKEITKLNPAPMVLKFEKVYHPSLLLAKKRYVGYKYETKNQSIAEFDAKGIETVRRDGIPAQQKVLEKSIRMLFETRDISKIKHYVMDQFNKILLNKVSIQDFCFSKEIKLGSYKSDETMPPGAMLVKKKLTNDVNFQSPQYRERIPYIIVRNGGRRLKDRAVLLEDLINHYNNNPHSNLNDFQLDGEYYITKMLIPPLERVFNLMGVDIKQWYLELPKSSLGINFENKNKVSEEDNLLIKHIRLDHCMNCNKKLDSTEDDSKLCNDCLNNKEESAFNLINILKSQQLEGKKYLTICRNCSVLSVKGAGLVRNVWCVSGDCPVYYSRIKNEIKASNTVKILEQLEMLI